MRASTSRGSNGARQVGADDAEQLLLVVARRAADGPGTGPRLRQLSRATIRRPIRSASTSSTATWSARPLTRPCIAAPPSSSSSAISPVAIRTSGGPPRNTLAPPSTITTWSLMPGR